MKDAWQFLAALVIVLALVLGNVFQAGRLQRVSDERDRYRNNTNSLMSDVEQYKVRDSLSAARVESLELTLKEFRKYRAEDAAIIKQLKSKNRDLQAVITSQSQSIYALSAVPRDTVIIRDSVKIGAKWLHCGDEWYDFDALLTDKEFSGNVVVRDSLLFAECIKYKRFLGFLWKTKKVQSRDLSVVNRNPHTQILGLEHIIIEE